jgi:hypothetical protein
MEIGTCSQSFIKLCGSDYGSDKTAWAFWSKDSMPLFKTFEAQKVEIEWGDEEDYCLCYNCQSEFLATIGRFFKMPERAKEILEQRTPTP